MGFLVEGLTSPVRVLEPRRMRGGDHAYKMTIKFEDMPPSTDVTGVKDPQTVAGAYVAEGFVFASDGGERRLVLCSDPIGANQIVSIEVPQSGIPARLRVYDIHTFEYFPPIGSDTPLPSVTIFPQ